MLFRWLTTVFPREMYRGWLLIRADLTFWCAVAAALALLALTPLAGADESDNLMSAAALALALLLQILVPALVLVIAAVRFAALRDGGRAPWAPVIATARKRLF